VKLIRARIENFKCIEESGEFTIDQVTCLVGKNESGKTALLEALYKLNPVEHEEEGFREEHYPRRHLSTYRERKEQAPANVVTTTWELDENEVIMVNDRIAPAKLKSPTIEITKGYDNKTKWYFSIDDAPLIEKALDEANLNAAERAQLRKAHSLQGLISILRKLEQPTEKQSGLLQQIAEQYDGGDLQQVATKAIEERLPHFLYYSTYYQLPGRVSINQLLNLKQSGQLRFDHKVFLALLRMANTSIEDIQQLPQLEKLVMELEAIEARLTDEIKMYWSQNRHLEVRFRFDKARPGDPPPFNDGFVFNVRIFNTRHRATVSFEDRSHGFIWFFSFLIWFSEVQREYGDNIIILLDEPGLPLHGRAQQDLLRYINDRLRPHHQVIYTAHSPFLIDIQNIYSVRSVEDVVVTEETDSGTREVILGTKVGERILSRDPDTLFPLQGILGFDITQTLFVGPYVLVVEGPTERAVIDWFSRQLSFRKRKALDIRWAVCPAEGASKISSFVTLFAGRGLTISVLFDYHEGQKRLVNQLKNSDLLPPEHILCTSDFAGKEESDIEDVIGSPMYLYLVNKSMGLSENHRIPKEGFVDPKKRLVKQVEEFYRVLPPGYPEFNHYRPIDYLLGLSEDDINQIPGLEEALNRFEAMFRKFNSLIGTNDIGASS